MWCASAVWVRTVAVSIGLVSSACGASEPSQTQADGASSGIDQSLAPVSTPAASVDVIFRGPEDTVLARRAGEPYIDAGAYNRWVLSRPMPPTGSDSASAQRAALEKMASATFILERAEREGYREKLIQAGRAPTPNALVMRYMKDRIGNPMVVSDADARAFIDEHPDQIGQLGQSGMPPDVLLMATKLRILSDRFDAELRRDMADAGITYEDVVVASREEEK